MNCLCHFIQPYIGVFLNCAQELIPIIFKVFACVLFKPLEFFGHLSDYSFKFCVLGSSRQFSLENISIVLEGDILPWLLILFVFWECDLGVWPMSVLQIINVFVLIGEMEVIPIQWLLRKHAKVTPSWVKLGWCAQCRQAGTWALTRLGWCTSHMIQARPESVGMVQVGRGLFSLFFSHQPCVLSSKLLFFFSQHQCFSFSVSVIVFEVNCLS